MNYGGPAFPRLRQFYAMGNDVATFTGMSLRDYFAAKALNGMLSNPTAKIEITDNELALVAYEYADAMLSEREKSK